MLSSISSKPRDVQVAQIGTDTTVLRSRTWDRLKFEVEYGRQRGTTANSYLIQAEKTAVIDPPGASFTSIYLQQLEEILDLTTLDYVILGHVNPNRMTTLAALRELAPQVTLVCTKPGANAINTAFPGWASMIKTVRSQDSLDLGKEHQLQFISAPTPRWPDGLCTYDPATGILYSDKFLGSHVCDDAIFDENWKQLEEDRRYYFDCLHAPQAKQVETTLDKIFPLPARCYAPGHGSLIKYSLSRLRYDYQQWCQQQRTQELRVALLYASAYGNTATLAGAIAHGLNQAGLAVESINCELADTAEITRAIEACDGFIIGSPTLGGHAPVQIQTALGIVLSTGTKTKLAGVFGSYGWSGEAIDLIESKLQDANYQLGFESLRVRFSPTPDALRQCVERGAKFAQYLKKTKKLRSPRQAVTETQLARTEQAVGRIIGSLCVITSQQDDTPLGVLTSWVSQASFNPPGLIIALNEEQNAEMMTQQGNSFVLNILKEGRSIRQHFSYCLRSGENPFPSLATQTATNGCLILTEALAYLECTVENRIKSGDHWLIYAVVNNGEVLEENGVTAIQHRKSGSHY